MKIKKQKAQKILSFKNYKNSSEEIHIESKKNYLEKNKVDIDSFLCYKRKHKGFIINNKY